MDPDAHSSAARPTPFRSFSPTAQARPPGLSRSARHRIAWSALMLLAGGPAGLSGQSLFEAPTSPSPVWEAVLANTFPAWPAVFPEGDGLQGAIGPGGRSLSGRGFAAMQPAPEMISPTRALLYSGVLPGLGQQRLDKIRWLGFMAVELAGWAFLWERRRTGHDFRTRYRDLAWFVARRGTLGERMDGDFEYYEALGKYRASGAFDADPYVGGVQPETDTTTFNGALWSLAREIYLVPGEQGTPGPSSPEYEQAMVYYADRSIGSEFQWDWNSDETSRAEYDRLIRRSDAALRQVTTIVGVILANHLAAAFDAFITARLRAVDAAAEVRLVAFPEARGRWRVGAQLRP